MARRYNVVPIIYTEILGFRGANRTGTCDETSEVATMQRAIIPTIQYTYSMNNIVY